MPTELTDTPPYEGSPITPVTRIAPATREETAAFRERGLRVMRDRLPELTDAVVTALRASEPAYRDGAIPPKEPPLWIGQSIDLALDTIRMPADERGGTLEWPRRLGRRRAGQGVPLQALLRAYHIGGRVVCDAFAQWSLEEGVATQYAASLIDDAWDVVDRHSNAALIALRTTEAALPSRQAAGALLDALLNGETDPGAAAFASRAFALPEQARYAVIVQQPTDATAAPLGLHELPARIRNVRVVWRMHGETAIGIAALGDLSATELGHAVPTRNGWRMGVSVAVEGLTELGRARQLAELAARTLTNGHGLASLDERLPATMLTVRPDLARELELRVLAPVLALDPTSRNLLLDTLSAWMAAEGSATRAAEALFCHRNTVLNRLRRLEFLTGRSLDNPKDLVEIALALEAFDIRRGARP